MIHFLLVLLHKRSSVYILSFHLSTHLERRAARVSWHDWIAFISSERFAIITRPQSKSQPASVDDSQMNNFCLHFFRIIIQEMGVVVFPYSTYFLFLVYFLRKTAAVREGSKAEYRSTPLMRRLTMKRRRYLILCLSEKQGY